MNSLQHKWLSRRIKHELSTKQMAVKTNFVLTAICFVESSYLIRLDCPLFCRVHVWFVLTAISFVESSCLIRLGCHLFCREFMFESSWQPFVELSTKQMAVKTNQTWTLYKTNGGHDESNMNSLQSVVESSCLIRLDCHFFCREFMFDSSEQPFAL
jgi:hypothetical protein